MHHHHLFLYIPFFAGAPLLSRLLTLFLRNLLVTLLWFALRITHLPLVA